MRVFDMHLYKCDIDVSTNPSSVGVRSEDRDHARWPHAVRLHKTCKAIPVAPSYDVRLPTCGASQAPK